MIDGLATCALCPRLCRPACPVTVATAREAATPTALASAGLLWQRKQWSDARAAEALTLCTDCGGCQAHCHIDYPLPDLLRQLRGAATPQPPMAPLQAIEGAGRWLAVESDARPLAAALAQALEEPVRRWRTSDRLGVAALEHAGFSAHAQAIQETLRGVEEVVVIDGGSAQALERAGVSYRWLQDVLPDLTTTGLRSCRSTGAPSPLSCCGGAGPLARLHPEDARRVGQRWLEETDSRQVVDARCRDHLRACGGDVQDPLDALLARLK